jgi:hypothetical protein
MPRGRARSRQAKGSPQPYTSHIATETTETTDKGCIYLDIDPVTRTVRLIGTKNENSTDTDWAAAATLLGDIVTEQHDLDRKDTRAQIKQMKKIEERNKTRILSTNAELAECKLQLRAAQNDIRMNNKVHDARHKNDKSRCDNASKELSDMQSQYDHYRARTVSTSMVGLHISKARAETDKANGTIKELRDTVKQLRETITKRDDRVEKAIAVVESTSLTTTHDLLEALSCPIGLTLFTDAVACTDGHSYDRSAITSWMRVSTLSPLDESKQVEIIGPDVCVNAAIAVIRQCEQYKRNVVE